MKQRISVRALIRKDNKTLLLKRANGRHTILGKYELPGGKLSYGEQPEDALSRYIHHDTGLIIRRAHLFDVITYIDHDDRDIQYTFILYLVSLEKDEDKVALSENYSHSVWKEMNDVPYRELTESAKLLLDISVQEVPIVKKGETVAAPSTVFQDTITNVIIYSDGGSRGNPGPSASGFVVMNEHEEVLHQGGAYLGININTQAEYYAVRLGLEKALEMKASIVDCRLDSLLVVNQLKGVYAVKDRELRAINAFIRELTKQFDQVTFSHIPREFNQLADGMVNKILNAHTE